MPLCAAGTRAPCRQRPEGTRLDPPFGQGLLSLDPEWMLVARQRPLVMLRLQLIDNCGFYLGEHKVRLYIGSRFWVNRWGAARCALRGSRF